MKRHEIVMAAGLTGLILLALSAILRGAEPAPVFIDGPATAEVGELVTLRAVADGALQYAWDADPDTLDFAVDSSGAVAYFSRRASAGPGEVSFDLAVVDVDGKLHLVEHTMTIGEGDDPPDPPPPPPPPPEPGTRWLILLRESSNQTNKLGPLEHSTLLRDYLRKNGHPPMLVRDPNEKDPWIPGYLKVVREAGATIPRLLIVAPPADGGGVGKVLSNTPPPTTDEAAIELLQEHGG
jgi:hypothetical protein